MPGAKRRKYQSLPNLRHCRFYSSGRLRTSPQVESMVAIDPSSPADSADTVRTTPKSTRGLAARVAVASTHSRSCDLHFALHCSLYARPALPGYSSADPLIRRHSAGRE